MAVNSYDIQTGTRLSEEFGYLCIRDAEGWLLWSTEISNLQGSGLFLCQVISDATREKRMLPSNPKASQ